MIKHSTEKPPNWSTLIRLFPSLDWNQGVIVTWGDTYYCKEAIEDDLIAHEETHMVQQEAMGIEEWWNKYYTDPVFRLMQEIAAYRNQVQYLNRNFQHMSRDERRARIRHMAKTLSSEVYGSIITYDRALQVIKS